ncbi:MAG: M20/M25/M40 family metallo-hydrolase [SAR86 cluster bacterium]|jgi:acetylornithine deacetylase/succinyl-diaminopimelate desuccinylase-like protein|tara:strand:+ start:6681 stop:8087 length:1407 start_codon:yes stop_codon:yes gene_type:complete
MRRLIWLLGAFWAGQIQAQVLDWRQFEADAQQTLVDLIRLDTSQPKGNEYLAANYLKQRLDVAGIASTIYEAAPGRASIVARIKGNGSQRPLLLLGHTDVVTVEPANWTFDPFSGTVKDGKIFGRGAADDKGIVAVAFEVLLALHRLQIPLDRDVIFLGVADEEGGGGLGITYMVENHLAAIDAEFALNEGGRGTIDPITGKYLSFDIGTAEKTPRRARLIAHGRAGHGSVPSRDNPVGVLSRAVARLFDTPLPMRLNETTRTFFERLAATRPEFEAEVYRAILEPNPSMETQERLRDLNAAYFSIIRTSVVPTIFQGGYQRNVIPSSAEATLDIRALPGEDPEFLFEALRNIIQEPSVEIIPMRVTRPAHQPAPLNTPLFQAFEDVIAARHPGATVLPSLLTGATDSAQLRSVGIATYGFGPGIVIGDDNGVHGNDEYLRVAPYREYLHLIWDIVNQVAATPSIAAE